jgi:tetratricopeptide (TPR) repeat protein
MVSTTGSGDSFPPRAWERRLVASRTLYRFLMEDVFLSPAHRARIPLAARAARPDAAAEYAWLTGSDQLWQALAEVAEGNPAYNRLAGAARDLEQALLRDPGMADAWLALMILDSLRPVDRGRYQAVLEALAVCSERLGEQQEGLGRLLEAYYVPLLETRVPIVTPTDARLIYVGHLALDDDHLAAEEWLERCDHALVQAVAAHAHLLLRRRDYADASDLFEGLIDDARFSVEGQLGAGLALAGMGLWDTAAELATQALEQASSRRLRLISRYVLASLLGHLDRGAERRELELIYAEEPRFADVASRLGRTGPPSLAELLALFDALDQS